MTLWHKMYPDKLNIVIVIKTNLVNGKRPRSTVAIATDQQNYQH
jgi:hypothetical protein